MLHSPFAHHERFFRIGVLNIAAALSGGQLAFWHTCLQKAGNLVLLWPVLTACILVCGLDCHTFPQLVSPHLQ